MSSRVTALPLDSMKRALPDYLSFSVWLNTRSAAFIGGAPRLTYWANAGKSVIIREVAACLLALFGIVRPRHFRIQGHVVDQRADVAIKFSE